MDKVKSAIELKEFIDEIPGTTDALGTCVSRMRAFYGDQEQVPPGYSSDDEELEEEGDAQEAATKKTRTEGHSKTQVDKVIQKELRDYYTGYKCHMGSLDAGWGAGEKIHVGEAAELDLAHSMSKKEVGALLEDLYNAGAPSPFGDVASQETRVDESVRRAREFSADAFRVSPEVCRQVERLWSEHFVPNVGIRAEPYKLNVYGPGDKFDEHTDTPGPGLVGTFLMGLGDTSYDGGLCVDAVRWYNNSVGTWCAFYSDTPHCVDKVEGGYRANLAFKIYAEGVAAGGAPAFEFPAPMVAKVASLLEHETGAFGILLEHDYSLNADQLKGFDRAIYDLFRLPALGFQHHIIVPVIVTEDGTRDDDTTEYVSCVYAIEDLLDPWITAEMPFYEASKGYCWSKRHDAGAEHTGNESRPEEIESLYLSRALILKK